VLIVLPNELEQIRIAVAASRHVGKAVKRNRAKRLIRAALQPLITSITPGWDILLIARQPMTQATIQETEQALYKLLIRAQLITKPHVNSIWNIPRFLVLGLFRLYQMTLSRGLPANTCRFYPSCSHYGYQAVYKYGALKGSFMAIWRVLRCNPFNSGGYDPVD
jgi:putative membrane protein insertion efficiency factor/ribonuclease P protein component